MSVITETSPKHCAKKGLNIEKRHKKLFFTISTLFTSLLFIIFLLWLTLHPAKPDFSLTQADIYQLNVNLSTPTHLLNSSIQLTLFSKNPNKKVSIYYDQLLAYASYRGQQITPEASIPPFYQSHEEINVLTAFLQGTGLPVAPSLGFQVGHDRTNGRLVLSLKLDGKLRWRVGTWVSGAYRFNVDCVAIVAFGSYMSNAPLASMQGTRCSTTI